MDESLSTPTEWEEADEGEDPDEEDPDEEDPDEEDPDEEDPDEEDPDEEDPDEEDPDEEDPDEEDPDERFMLMSSALELCRNLGAQHFLEGGAGITGGIGRDVEYNQQSMNYIMYNQQSMNYLTFDSDVVCWSLVSLES